MPPTIVQVTYIGKHRQIQVDLQGHDAQRHADQILAEWLRTTAKEAGLTPEEDDAGDWVVREFRVLSNGRVRFRGVPYRGEQVTLSYLPPEM